MRKCFFVKIFLSILLLIFSFQSWSKADDVSEFEIEGMSIGDSALDFVKKDYLLAHKKDWFKSNSEKGWLDILNKVRDKVNLALKENKSRKIDFIGHSSGGVMLRLYLSDQPFNNEIFNGKSHTKNLITLGSPHQAVNANALRKFVDEKYPGNFFKNINYVSVGGEVEIKSKEISLITKIIARGSYKSISGDKNADGDGLVPLSSSTG